MTDLSKYRNIGIFAHVDAGKTTQLAYGDVTIGGTPEALVLTSTDGTVAGVVCGNVLAANGTIFVVDTVLTPALP